MTKVLIRDNECVDDLQIKGFQLIQPRDGFRFGMDAVLLSDYARVKKGCLAADLCSGTGIIPVLLYAKYEPAKIIGLEYQESCVEIARRSIALNDLSDHISMLQGDVCRIADYFQPASCDYVTCNPPYMPAAHGLTNPDQDKAIARHEILCTLTDVVKAAAWMLKPGGHFVMVHRPFRLAEIICRLKEYRLEPKRMRLVYPYVDKEPNMVLIDAVKGGKERVTLDPPLIVYEKNGVYTREIYEIYGIKPGIM